MNAQRATVTEIRGTKADEITAAAQDVPAAYDARMDPEAKLLCALLWVAEPAGTHITEIVEFLSPVDFRRPAHARLFDLIRTQVAAGEPLDPTIIAGQCDAAGAAGRDGWPSGVTPQSFILDIASLEARPSQASYLAELVISASYRAQFQSMTTYLTQIGQEADVDDLFDVMVEQGRRQRAARARLDAFRQNILGQGTGAATDENTTS
jgi:replicative DNA helicase